ncbi:MAG: ABC transporter permease [Eubacteriales bacterium]|nr:ABC transporter permease [Eubacteriales bacterium]
MSNGKKFSFARFYDRFGVLCLLAIVVIIATILTPNFLTRANISNVLRQNVSIIILGCGCCFVLISGNINIAYDGLIACIGTISALVMAATQNLFISVIVGMIVGAVFGYLYGIFVSKFQIPPFICGLAFSSVATGIIMLITNGVAVPKTKLGNFSVLGQGYISGIPISVIIMIVILVASHIILTKTCFGMKVKAVGGNREAAITSGINVGRVIRQVFVLDGVICAIAAVLYMSRINSGDGTAGSGICFDAITAVCVGGVSIQGGTGGIIGMVFGGCIVGVINNLLNLLNVDSNWQDVVSGLIILFAVAVDIAVKNSLTKKK